MKKYLLALITILSFQERSVAQNMVTNGSFEQYTNCPNNFTQLSYTTGWQSASSATPDYFNECASVWVADIPKNLVGWQYASEGTAYAGLLTYEHESEDYAEYLQGILQQLTPGHHYQVSLKTSLADSSYFATNGIAAYFFVDNIGLTNPMINAPLDLDPQVTFQNYGAITDSLGWVTLTDTLFADSAYKHIVIGRFIDTSVLDIVRVDTGVVFNFAYYYIDEVSVVDLDTVIKTDTNVTYISTIGTIANVQLSPNPFSNSTTLTFDNRGKNLHTFFIYNIEGRLVRKIEHIRTGELSIDRNDLDVGCYFYELRSEDGAVAKGKLFVQ